MKIVKLVIATIVTLIVISVLSSSVYAGTVSSVLTIENEGKISVSGSVDSSVYAVAILVYSGDNLEYMETANVNADGTYNTELEKKFDYGTYEVRVADYNGGEYKTASIAPLMGEVIILCAKRTALCEYRAFSTDFAFSFIALQVLVFPPSSKY